MRFFLLFAFALVTLACSAPVAAADITRLELIQRDEVVLAHQRFVGNTQAQAKRDGVITRLPQLYVYLTDHSAAWHMQGLRRNFERELSLIFDRQRRERSMVRLDRLLERTHTADGEAFTPAELPEADIFIVLYHDEDCAECSQLSTAMQAWLDGREALDVVWIDVQLRAAPDDP